MLGLDGLELSAEEHEILQHPLVGGVILFSRNYQSPTQMTALTAAIRARRSELLIAVDHEGGPVQRFRAGFTRLPAMRELGERYQHDNQLGLRLAYHVGWLMAIELHQVGVDFSFAPVLDLDYAVSAAIRNRAFHRDPKAVTELAGAYMNGMRAAGMAAVGKHFPGHGYVAADSHHEIPVDERSFAALLDQDLQPFSKLIAEGLAAVIPAHVIYPCVDEHPAGFSKVWLGAILRRQLGFQGAVFSDDLGMAGAAYAGGPLARARAALAAGCDMVLACNERAAALAMLEGLITAVDGAAQPRLQRMRADPQAASINGELTAQPAWQAAVSLLAEQQLV